MKKGIRVSILFLNRFTAVLCLFLSILLPSVTFGGGIWEAVGSKGISDGEASYTSLAISNGTPYVAYSDGADSYKATVVEVSDFWVDIKANGSDEAITVSTSNPVSVTVSLEAGPRAGEVADWWVGATTGFYGNWYSYVYPTGWTIGINRCVESGLFSFTSFEVLNKTLPVGNYTFYFALDYPDGKPTWDFWAIDSVAVTVK